MKLASIQCCTATVLLTAAAGQTLAVDKSWNVANGSWNTPGNWLGGVPLAGDNALIGNTVPAVNGFVTLNVNATVASLNITDGMSLNTQASRMVVTGNTSISGRNDTGNVVYPSRIQVSNGPNYIYDFVTHDLTVSNGAWIELEDSGVHASGLLHVNDGLLYGDGKVRLTSNDAVALRNDGTIDPGVNGLIISQEGTGRIDLDGSLADDRFINISTYRNDLTAFAHLSIIGDQLTDTYDEGIMICEGGFLDMQLTNGWAMGANSTLEFITTPSNIAARVYGTQLSFDGEMLFPGTGAHGQFYCPVIFQPNAQVTLGDLDSLQVSNTTVVNGGVFDMTGNSRIYFDGDITMHGGTFNADAFQNPVYFYGETTWDGNVTFNASAQQVGDAQVVGASTINADVFDMDGIDNSTTWTLYDVLTINAAAIEFANGQFDGVINNHGELIIHLDNPADSWMMGGTMNVTGPYQIGIMRFEGSRMDIRGALNVTGVVATYAPFTFNSGSTTTFADAQSWLHCGNDVRIGSGATFVGQAALRADWGHHLILDHQADMGQMWLINNDDMEINPDAPGSARVGRFEQMFDGSWKIDIGGSGEGTLNDYLFVTGAGAQLAGTVNVQLLDMGNGPFLPTIGQTFHILNARAGVSGAFNGSPTSVTPQGTLVQWSFIYTATDVYLRCDSITERCPADFNHDGIVDFFDYLDFVDAFAAEDMISDFNHDGVIDFFDYLDFVDAFAAGC